MGKALGGCMLKTCLQSSSRIALAAFGLACVAAPAHAQDASSGAGAAVSVNRSEGGDIVVTARRRNEALQDVPVAVTALTGEMLQERAITEVADLTKAAPGLNVTTSPRGGASPFVVIRGQRVIDTSIVFDAPVLFYVNDVPWMRVNGLNQAFYDIENVQVLRGPQGTLFGKSTTGGAVLVNSRKANPGEGIAGSVKATVGNFDLLRLEGAVNLPITDNLAIRLAGIVSDRKGYMKARNEDRRYNDEHYNSQRISLRYENGAVESDLVFSRWASHDNGTAPAVYTLNPTASFLPFVLSAAQIAQLQSEISLNNQDYYSVGTDFSLRVDNPQKTWDVTSVVSIELSDNLTLKNIASYREVDAPIGFDLDSSSVNYQRFLSFTDSWQFSEELQLQGDHGNFEWIAGVFYLKEKGYDGAVIRTPLRNRVQESGTFAKNESYSAFLNGTYRFGETGFSLAAGARISHDKREGGGLQTDNLLISPTDPVGCVFTLANGSRVQPPCLYNTSISFTEPSWSVNLSYDVNPDLLLYAAHRHGYRSGGVQNRATTEAAGAPFDAETVNDIELGAKFSTNIGSNAQLLLNGAAYRAWYKSLQRGVSYISPVSGTIVTGFANAADATIQGIEFEGSLRVGGFELAGSFGYTDAQYEEYSEPTATGGVRDFSDTPFGYVPEWTYNIRAGYVHELENLDERLYARVSLSHVDKIYLAERPVPNGFLPGYDLVDLVVGWDRIAGSSVSLTASITNLLKEEYSTAANTYTDTLGWAQRYPAPPRRVQASLTYDF